MTDDWDEDEDWDDEDWDEDEPAARQRARGSDQLSPRSLALGVLSMAPMFLVYELALAAVGRRNTSELMLFRLFEVFGSGADMARWIALVCACTASLVWCLGRNLALGPRLLSIVGQGILGAIVIGPLLMVLAARLFDAPPPLGDGGRPGDQAPGLAQAAFVFGAGAYEELFFRVGAYSLLYVLALHVLRFLGAEGRVAALGSDAVGLLGSAVLFSAFHLAFFVRWLGPGGEHFDGSIFTYRFLAGVLLGLLFRLRGPGVAAWTHGLYNLALLLGAGPHPFT